MGKSEDLARDRKPAPLGVTRRHILPLVGATAASAVILPHSLAAAPPDPSEKPSSATARFVYVGTYGSRRSARWNPPEHGRRHLCI